MELWNTIIVRLFLLLLLLTFSIFSHLLGLPIKYKILWKPTIYNMKKHLDSISSRLKYILLKYILLSKCFVKWVLTWYNSRSSGHSAPLLPAPAEGQGALWALLGAFGPLFITIKLYFESEFLFFLGEGGVFYKTFLFEVSLYMFLIFGNLGGVFWVWFWCLKISKSLFESEFQLLVGSVL